MDAFISFSLNKKIYLMLHSLAESQKPIFNLKRRSFNKDHAQNHKPNLALIRTNTQSLYR